MLILTYLGILTVVPQPFIILHLSTPSPLHLLTPSRSAMAPTRPTPLTPYTPYTYDYPVSQKFAYNPSSSPPPIPSTILAPTLTIQAIPLTASTFAPYGTVIGTSLSPHQNTIPYPPPQGSISANQGTALKYSSVTPQTNNYHLSPSGSPAAPTTSLYSCFPRALRTVASTRGSEKTQIFDVRILERHPYTTQTFIPLATHSPSPSNESRAIIIVAPTLPPPPISSSSGTPYFPQATSISIATAQGMERGGGMPDLRGLKAFVAEPGQGVTYAAGTWHAPMVVEGDQRMDFVVSQWMSGRAEEDCQEVEIGEGLCVDLGSGKVGEREGLWTKPRL